MASLPPGALPPGALRDGPTRVLLAVVAGDRFIPDICARVGLVRSTVYVHLAHLEEEGLVVSAHGPLQRLKGTIQPRVRLVA